MQLGCTVRELLARIDSAELSEWLAYDRIEPLPDSYWQAGMIASVMAGLWSKGRYTPQDFMPRKRTAPRQQSPEEQKAILGAILRAHAARVKGRDGL